MAKRRAVLIGINRYEVPGADLQGCVNDVGNVEKMLLRHFDFTKAGIRTLTDGRATTERMRNEITRLVGDLRSGDVGLLHYSGHGSNVPDDDGDEADGRDEILCPTDLDWKDPLTDDWIREQLDRVPEGANLTVFFDCCHSGTATRAFPKPDEPRSRFLAHPYDLVASESGRSLRGRTRRSGARRRRTKDVSVAKIPEVLLTGCRDDQTSADARIRGNFEGAMSHSLVRTVNAARGRLTNRELHEGMLEWLSGKYEQVPQLEGRRSHLDHPVLQPF